MQENMQEWLWIAISKRDKQEDMQKYLNGNAKGTAIGMQGNI